MNFWHAILLGVVQGIAEFLPISSSGHLAVLQNLFQISAPGENDLFFDILLHIGTLFAVLLAYRKDISAFIREAPAVLRKNTNEKTQKSASLSLRLLLLLGSFQLLRLLHRLCQKRLRHLQLLQLRQLFLSLRLCQKFLCHLQLFHLRQLLCLL